MRRDEHEVVAPIRPVRRRIENTASFPIARRAVHVPGTVVANTDHAARDPSVFATQQLDAEIRPFPIVVLDDEIRNLERIEEVAALNAADARIESQADTIAYRNIGTRTDDLDQVSLALDDAVLDDNRVGGVDQHGRSRGIEALPITGISAAGIDDERRRIDRFGLGLGCNCRVADRHQQQDDSDCMRLHTSAWKL